MTTAHRSTATPVAVDLPPWLGRVIGFACLLLAFLLVSDNSGGPVDQIPSIWPEALRLTRQLEHITTPEGYVRHIHADLVQTYIDQEHLDLAAAQHLVDDILSPALSANLPLLESALARIWMSQFSQDEIADLHIFFQDPNPQHAAAFFATPLGQKYEIVGPEMDVAIQNTTRLWLAMTSRAAFAARPDEVRLLGLDPKSGARLPPAK